MFPASGIILRESEECRWRGQMLRITGHVLLSLPNAKAQRLPEAGPTQERTL
jgi:hypothetical protein